MAQGYSARAHFPSLTTTMIKASVERPLWSRGEKLRELFRMVFVLTAICSVSALVLAYANKGDAFVDDTNSVIQDINTSLFIKSQIREELRKGHPFKHYFYCFYKVHASYFPPV